VTGQIALAACIAASSAAIFAAGCAQTTGAASPGAPTPAAASAAASAPQYPIPYGAPKREEIIAVMQRVRQRLEANAPMRILEHPTTREGYFPPDYQNLPASQPVEVAPMLDRGPEGKFALISYPMGVIFSGMLSAADATGDPAYADFVNQRLQFLGNNIAKVPPNFAAADVRRSPFRALLSPMSLDDCGAIGASFIKARRANVGPDMLSTINRFAEYISHGQLRLDDGTLARNRPFKNSVWGDDEYMSVPFLAQMGALTGDTKYYDDAAKQLLQISQRLFVPSTGLFTHAWNTFNPDDHPHYYWGRANGWCMMAAVELLDVLPPDHPARPQIIKLLQTHAQAVASLQSGSGLWHQMLDRPDSYLETSCSAMFAYSIARAVNHGWLDAAGYGPVAEAAWNGIATQVTADGKVEGVCVGTSYADDYIYYYYRPRQDDIHGYGPVLLAGSEMIRMLNNPDIRINTGRGGPVYYLDPKRDTIPGRGRGGQ
jgi:rhamnogalacturonyl hydrolase YesR